MTGPISPLKGIIFDLYGTLVYDRFANPGAFEALVDDMASSLQVNRAMFRTYWESTYFMRVEGRWRTVFDCLVDFSERSGITIPVERLRATAELNERICRESHLARDAALDVLKACRLAGVRMGLMSDCAPATPAVFPSSPLHQFFEATVYSCRVGMRKPAAALYERCLEKMGVAPTECLYVGDGNGRELTGAQRLGLRPILIKSRNAPEDPGRWLVDDWNGERIEELSELPVLAGLANG
jgi:putative hydrolase of the HAD superfamily